MSRLVNPFIRLAQVKQKLNKKLNLTKLTIINISNQTNEYISQNNNKVGWLIVWLAY
jgi:hypothetical protein